MDLIVDLWPLALLVILTTLLTEWATKSGKFPYWIGRKILHVIAVGSCAFAVLMTDELTALFWLILPIWLVLFYLIATNKLMQDEQGRPAWGIVWFPLAYLILLWFYDDTPDLIFSGMAILAICDPMATIFGKLYGRHQYSLTGESKSIEGSLAFFVSAVLVTITLTHLFGIFRGIDITIAIVVILLSALLLTFSEALGSYGSDNFLIPFATLPLSFEYPMLIKLLPLFLLAIPFTWLTVSSKKLTLGGAITATLLAIIVTSKSGSYLPILPMVFLLGSCIILEKIFPTNLLSDTKDRQPRDIIQVLVTGGVYGTTFLFLPKLTGEFIGISQTGKVAVSLYEAQRESVVLGRFLLGMGLVSLAVATADTWASTIGKRFGGKSAFDPFRWQKVPAGLSGGISLPGTLAALMGSISIACFLYLLLPDWKLIIPHLGMISIAGFAGMLLDSFLGSRLQRQYFYSGRWHDTPPEAGEPEQTRGLSWMTNDVVNLVSILVVCGALGVIFLVR